MTISGHDTSSTSGASPEQRRAQVERESDAAFVERMRHALFHASNLPTRDRELLLALASRALEPEGDAVERAAEIATLHGIDGLQAADAIRAEADTPPADQPTDDGWRDIASAPKDGTPILVARDMGEPWNWVRGWATWEGRGIVSGWVPRGFFEVKGVLGLGGPTHWRPLPPPPSART